MSGVPSSSSSLSLRIGSEERASGGDVVNISRVISHENHDNREFDFDYALLELSEPLTFSNKVQPIKLPNQDDVISDGSLCKISGWGNTLNSSESNKVIREVTIPIVNQEKCVAANRDVATVTPRMICAGYEEGGKDSKR